MATQWSNTWSDNMSSNPVGDYVFIFNSSYNKLNILNNSYFFFPIADKRSWV